MSTRLGSVQRPVESREALKLARAVKHELFTTESGGQGLWWFRGNWWVWRKGQWEREYHDRVFHTVWQWAEDVYYTVVVNGSPTARRLAPSLEYVREVTEALKGLCWCPWVSLPVWTTKEYRPPVEQCIAFLDGVVNLENGQWMPRGEEWLGPVVQAEAKDAPEPGRWLRALQEWSNGDPQWVSLLQRWMGYCLMNHRRYAKWMLMEGKVRGGKGTITGVLRKLLGETGFFSSNLEDLAGTFGLEGLEAARVLVISEISALDKLAAGRAGRIFKNIVGRDPLAVNMKHRAQVTNVILDAVPMVSANEIPDLPNQGQGLSSKMLVLPFGVSWLGKEQFDLGEELGRELAGIAAWALQGAMALQQEKDPSRLWPTPERSEEVREEYQNKAMPLNAFMEARFVKDPNGFVPNHLLRVEWQEWAAKTGYQGPKVHINQLASTLTRQTTWPVEKTRTRDIHGNPEMRGLKGISLRARPQDQE